MSDKPVFTALLKIKVTSASQANAVAISEETARSIAGAFDLPALGSSYAVFWGKVGDQVVDTMQLGRAMGCYYLRSTKYPVTAWPEIFKIEVEEIS